MPPLQSRIPVVLSLALAACSASKNLDESEVEARSAALSGRDDRTIVADDLGVIRIVDADRRFHPGVEYRSNRDAGYSVSVDSDEDVPALRRQLFIFGDSGGSRITAAGDIPLPGYYPSNSASIVEIGQSTLGAPELPPLPAAMFWFYNEPRRFLPFISDGTVYPVCQAKAGESVYPAEWPKGAVQLPDNDPERDTVAIFYQNLCVRRRDKTVTYDLLDGGVAAYTWERAKPDDVPNAQVLNDRLFPPGMLRDKLWKGIIPGHPYGIGPLLFSEDGSLIHLYAYQCGFRGDCTLARVPVSSAVTGATNMTTVADGSQWQYLTEDGAWQALPMAGTRVSCLPTPDDDCGGFPRAQAVIEAVSGQVETQPNAAPSFRTFGPELRMGGAPVATHDTAQLMIYAPPYTKDHAAARYRLDGSPAGAWSDPVGVNYPASDCADGCRAPIFQPELDDGDNLAFSYYSDHYFPNPGYLRLARVCWRRYLGLDATCDCGGETTGHAELCNGIDDNCNGR